MNVYWFVFIFKGSAQVSKYTFAKDFPFVRPLVTFMFSN